jgi:hypothetical protein
MSRPVITFDPGPHTYLVDGEEGYPSVTQIIDATVPKPFSAAAWWGYKLGVTASFNVAYSLQGTELLPPEFEGFYELVKSEDNPNKKRDKAGDRGTAIHDALERYAKTGAIPAPSDFPEEDRARVTGVVDWLLDNRPEYLGAEVRTASLKHKYVGSLDAYVLFHKGNFKGKTARLDYKTSKNVYPDSMFPQLAAYEQAEVECGEPASDLRLILHIPEDGVCNTFRVSDTFSDFRVLLAQYKSKQGRDKKAKQEKEKVKAAKAAAKLQGK